MKKRLLSLLLALLLVLGIFPGTAWATEAGAESITVYMTVSFDGTLVKDKDNLLMAQRKLTVTDKDGDGKFTIDDAMCCAHEQYYESGAAGYTSSEGTATKLWGTEKGENSILFGIRYQMKSLIADTTFEISENERNFQISAALFKAGNTPYTSRFVENATSAFTAKSAIPSVVLKGMEFPLKLVYGGTSNTTVKFLSGYETAAYTLEGDPVSINSTTSDKNGQLKVTFPEAGTYVLTAKPSATATITTSVPACIVTVLENAPEYSSFQIAADKDMQSPLTLDPAFSPEKSEYTVEIPEGLDATYALLSLKDAMEGLFWKSASLMGDNWVTAATLYPFGDSHFLSVPKNARGLRFYLVNQWNVFLHTCTITVKRLPALSSLGVEGFEKSAFNPNGNTYELYIDPSQESIDVTPVAKNADYSITVEGKTVTSGQTVALLLKDLTFDVSGKAKVLVGVHAEGELFADNTYTLVLEKEPNLEKPTILLQPEGADYIQGGTSIPLEIYASTGGALSYQWCSNENNSSEGRSLISGATSSSYTPPTETVGTVYYYCVATNTATGKTTVSNSACVVVEPDPTPSIQWDVEVPEVAPEHKELFGEYTHGFYYKQGDTGVMPLKVKASSAVPGGEYSYRWTIKSISSAVMESANETYTPKTDEVYGLRWAWCEVQYTYKGVSYEKRLSDTPIAVYVDKVAVTFPDEIKTAWNGNGTAENPWQLTSQADLTKLKGFVDQGYDFSDMHLKMTQDISLDDTWDSIGGGSGEGNGVNLKPFSGTLDGGDFTLMYAEGTAKPLFRHVRESTVHNLKIYAPYFKGCLLVSDYVVDYGVDGDYNIGIGGSYAPGCPDTIDIEKVTVKSGSWVKGGGFIDGGASGGNTVNIRNCEIEQGVTMGKDKITGEISGNIASFAGRMCGTIINCVSYADLYSTGPASGIVSGKSQSMGMFYVVNCAFRGSITSTGSYVGGIIGMGYMANSAPNTLCVTIQNCYVDATLKGADKVGGIYGGEPSCIQNWSPAYIRNNHFYGTLEAISENGSVGSIVGYMTSLNKYNVIEDNFYLETSGAKRAIGGAGYVDTSNKTHETNSGATYFNTEEVKPAIEGVSKEDLNRTDDPLGKDSEKLAKPVTKAAMADGSVMALLNKGEGSLKNWIQGEKFPVISDKPVAYEMGVSGKYKDTYYIGDELDLSGIVFTAMWSDGTVTHPTLGDVKITGFDSSRRAVVTLAAAYGAAKTEFTVTVLKASVPESDKIIVYFTLLGDEVHDSDKDGQKHTLKNGNLETWIGKTAYTVNMNSKVRDVFEKALTDAGMTWKNPTGNYVSSITRNGVELAEFTNGQKSGWMYTLNGTHPTLGLNEQFLENGNDIVWHYTDDYPAEEGSGKWNEPGSSSNGTSNTTLTPTATANGGAVSIELSLSDMKDAINNVKSNSNDIVITPSNSGTVGKISVSLSLDALNEVAVQTTFDLDIQTPVGNVKLPNTALDSISSQTSGNNVTVSLNTVNTKVLTSDQQKAVGSSTVYDISILSGSSKIYSFGGSNIMISLPYTLKIGEDPSGVTVWHLDDSGKLQQMMARYDKTKGMATFTTTHLSYYVVGYTAPWTNPFIDVKTTDWFYNSVKYVSQISLMSGASSTAFAPNDDMTRAMLVTVLYRLDGKQSVSGTSSFADVTDDQWYTNAVKWAFKNGIVTGYGGGLFGTNDSVTREQLAVILMNYAKYKGYDVTKTTDLKVNTDVSDISSWAMDAMKWAVANDLVTGASTTPLHPLGSAARVQVATVLMRFCENIVK